MEIRQAACDLLEQYGADAVVEAAMRSDRMMLRGDSMAADKWIDVIEAIDDLMATRRQLHH